ESLKAGATDYVIKSHLAHLPPVVARALRERDEQRQRREAEARYRDLFENANDMIYTRNLNGNFTSVNGMGERLTGYTREQLLAQKMESIGTLAGGVAHDFNNVLTAIIGNIQLVLESTPAESLDYPMLAEIEKAATRATALTRQLLTFSRRQPIERRTIDLNA